MVASITIVVPALYTCFYLIRRIKYSLPAGSQSAFCPYVYALPGSCTVYRKTEPVF